MLNFTNLFEMQIMIFLLTIVGFFISKKNILDKIGRKQLTNIVVMVVLPCNIVYSFLIEMDSEILKSGFLILIVSICIQLLCFPLGLILYKKFGQSQKQVLRYATICSNAGFIGNPLVESIYGSNGLLLASIYLIPQRIFMWSAGISCFTKAKGKEVIKKLITHPCIVAVIIGLIIMIFQIPIPSALSKTIKTVSNCTTALSMIIIGGILSEINIKSVLSLGILYFCFVRLIVIPGIVLTVSMIMGLPHLVISVATVLSGMPAGTTTAILAAQYNCDKHFAARCVFLSTVLSLITIPAFCILIESLF